MWAGLSSGADVSSPLKVHSVTQMRMGCNTAALRLFTEYTPSHVILSGLQNYFFPVSKFSERRPALGYVFDAFRVASEVFA